jgi:hypothetical protein
MFGEVVRYTLQNVTDHGVSNCGKCKTTLRRKMFSGRQNTVAWKVISTKKFEIKKE